MRRIGGRGRNKRDGAERDWCRSSPEAVYSSNPCRRGNHPMATATAPASQVSSTKTRRHVAKTYWHFRKRESPAVRRQRGDSNTVTKTSPMECAAVWSGTVHCADVSSKLVASIIRLGGSLKLRCHKLAQTSSCPRRPSWQHLHCHLVL